MVTLISYPIKDATGIVIKNVMAYIMIKNIDCDAKNILLLFLFSTANSLIENVLKFNPMTYIEKLIIACIRPY